MIKALIVFLIVFSSVQCFAQQHTPTKTLVFDNGRIKRDALIINNDLKGNPIDFVVSYYFQKIDDTCNISTTTRRVYIHHKKFTVEYRNYVREGWEKAYYKCSEVKLPFHLSDFPLKYSGKWWNGKKNGKWKYYSKEGVLIKKEVYREDELIKTKEFN